MNFFIRYADIRDSKILGLIHSESWKVAYKNIIPDSVLNNICAEEREKYFYKALTEKLEEDVLIFKGNRPAGFMTFGNHRDEDLDGSFGEIWGIYLMPDYWRQGIGKYLIRWGIEELKERGYKTVTLWVLEENKGARKFYERLGFNHDGGTKLVDIRIPLKALRYRKAI